METKLNINVIEDGSIPLSKLSEIPTAESSVFEAVYGVTTYDELVAAFNAKKHVLCLWNNRMYNLSSIDESKSIINFSSAMGGVIYLVYIDNGVWGNRQDNLEIVRNLVQTISSTSATSQYPSAKAVYDFVQTTLGTIINGDY